MVNVDYSRQTLETPNPIARFAHKKRYAHSVREVLKVFGDRQTLLDYGCGKGDFLYQINILREGATLFGYDPEAGPSSGKYKIVTRMGDMEKASVDCLCSFETLEHLRHNERQYMYKEAKRVLKNAGTVFISVPVIGGPTLFLKEFNRVLLFKRRSEYSFKELVLACFLGIPAEKPENPRVTHKGFNFREIEKEIESNFQIKEKKYSPFPVLPWYLNSQVLYVCGNRRV